jgi:hypothetical protein
VTEGQADEGPVLRLAGGPDQAQGFLEDSHGLLEGAGGPEGLPPGEEPLDLLPLARPIEEAH